MINRQQCVGCSFYDSDCNTCSSDAYCDTELETVKAESFRQGRKSVLNDIISFKDSLDPLSEYKLMDACDVILSWMEEIDSGRIS